VLPIDSASTVRSNGVKFPLIRGTALRSSDAVVHILRPVTQVVAAHLVSLLNSWASTAIVLFIMGLVMSTPMLPTNYRRIWIRNAGRRTGMNERVKSTSMPSVR
jgi:hypothetical protein